MAKNLDRYNAILSDAIKKIRPKTDILMQVNAVIGKIDMQIKKSNIAAFCMVGGSIGKNTYLRDDYDVDLFVRFNIVYREQNISDISERLLKEFNPERIHGSRDYFQFIEDGINYEVIPVLNIRAADFMSAQNITDMSPEHVIWVKRHTDKNPKLNDEIRLAKQFCKANSVYGAESYINGFSGHILDILVIHFGSFMNLIKEFSKYEKQDMSISENPIIIDTEKHLKDPLKELNKSKISPLIIVDPIQKDRNAAAALSKEKLERFILSCKNFLCNPSKDYFIIKKFDIEKSITGSLNRYRHDARIIIVKIKTLQGSRDICGTKVFKVYEDIIKHSALNDFIVKESGWDFDHPKKSATMYFIFDASPLDKEKEHAGPPISKTDDREAFDRKYVKTYVKGNRVYANIKRRYIIPEDFLKSLFEENFIKSRVHSIRIGKVMIKRFKEKHPRQGKK